MKVGVINTISAHHISQFQKDGIEKIIFTKIEPSVSYTTLASSFTLVNAFENTSEANWYNFNLVAEKTKKLSSAFPGIFMYKGYNLQEALNKDLFWAYLFTNALLFEANKIKGNPSFIFYDNRPEIKKRLALFRKIFLYKHNSYQILPEKQVTAIEKKIAFRLNDPFMVDVYGNLFEKLGIKNVLPFQSINNRDTSAVNKQMLETFGLNFTTKAVQRNPFKLSPVQKVKLFLYNEDPDFINTLIYLMNTLCNHVDEYERLFSNGVKKVILNAGENEGEGNVLCMVASKMKGVTFNYMNGTKAKDPQNMHSYFDYWFMPDQNTQELLLSYCELSPRQLPVTGHVLQDSAELHQYSGTLDLVLEKIKNKKVIALLTSRIYALEKQDVLKMLRGYLDKHKDVVVLVRKHPSETEGNDAMHERIIPVPSYTERMVQKSLFDLFLKSSVAISFSSMVSFQASWFNIPSINFELSEKSRLPFVDDKAVFHANSTGILEKYLDKFLMDEMWKPLVNNKSHASQNIADILLKE